MLNKDMKNCIFLLVGGGGGVWMREKMGMEDTLFAISYE